MKLLLSRVVVLTAACTVLLPLQAAAQPADSTFGETIEVRVVNVEAVVTDRNGVRVYGLTSEDFRLLIDGEETPIEFFTEIRGGKALREQGAADPDIAPISEGQAQGTSYLVFIDDFFSVALDRNRVLGALREQLTFLREEDRMAIVAWDGRRVQMLSSWTTDAGELEALLQEASSRRAGGLMRLSERRSHLSGPRVTPAGRSVGGRRIDASERLYADLLIDQMKASVSAASATLRGFATPPGRKVMLLLTGGWPFSPGDFVTGDPISAERDFRFDRGDQIYRPLVETANLLGYTLYPIDAPGLQTGAGFSAASSRAFRRAGGLRSLDFFRETELHYTLQYLARETGGRPLINGRRLEPLSLVAEDTSSFYWMGFTPPRSGKGETYAIELETRRPELEVRNRSGYRDLSRTEEVDMQVESTLLFGEPARSGELEVVIGKPGPRKRKTVLVPVTIRLPVSAIALLPRGEDEYTAVLEVRVAAIDDRGDRSEVTTLKWSITRNGLPRGDETIEYTTSLQLRRRPQDLVVAVYDPQMGALFSSTVRVDPVT